MDNERPFDENIVLLSKTDEIIGFNGQIKKIAEGDYVFLYMDIGEGDYVFSEGIVIKNPYLSDYPICKWCCKLLYGIEYMSAYQASFE
ncbi:MAG: hypothetical protein LBQ52_04050 [Helicobacteraceae bacterium]|jgi:hypothetical protein|nr:hypothetical protein [Helicobacteraceae bacterium]